MYLGPLRLKTWSIGLLSVCAIACETAPKDLTALDDAYTVEKFNAPIGVAMTANTGDSIFVEGEYIKGKALRLTSTMKGRMPGAYGVPFSFEVQAGDLILRSKSSEWDYFCSDPSKATATFPGLGTVVSRRDCIGVRQNSDTGAMQWVVDNSDYNSMTTIWHRDVKAEDEGQLQQADLDVITSVRELSRIIYDGKHSGLFHFTYENRTSTTTSSTPFSFDESSEGGTLIGIRGKVFKIISADNTGIVYEWVQNQ